MHLYVIYIYVYKYIDKTNDNFVNNLYTAFQININYVPYKISQNIIFVSKIILAVTSVTSLPLKSINTVDVHNNFAPLTLSTTPGQM